MKSPPVWKRARRILVGLVALLVLVVIVQNRRSVDTHFLFMTVTMPRAVLLLTTLLIGFAIGTVFGHGLRRRQDGSP